MEFRPFIKSPEPIEVSAWLRVVRHPVYACLGLRPVFAQHTRAEHEALRRWASGRRQIVELGVAEGGSAVALAEVMSPSGVLTLVDPFHLSRWKSINATRRIAHRAVARVAKGTVRWVDQMSFEALPSWKGAIDFLLIDADHEKSAVLADWNGWSAFVSPGGVVAFHDARVFQNGWPSPSDGPVVAVDELFRSSSPVEGWQIIEEVHSLVVVRQDR